MVCVCYGIDTIMEVFKLNDRRNPALARAVGEELVAYGRRLDEYIQRLVWNSEGHRMWFTHKNPAGCWICDLIFIIEQLRTSVIHENNETSGDTREDLNIPKSE